MNELSITVLLAVGRTTILLAVAALFAGGLLGVVRSSSPVVHRMAWCLVLVVGWLFLRLPVAIPYGESPAQSSRSGATPTTSGTKDLAFSGQAPTDSTYDASSPEPIDLASETLLWDGLPCTDRGHG